MPGHSRPKDGVASLTYVPGIFVLLAGHKRKTAMTTVFTRKETETGRKLFAGDWQFHWAAANSESLPPMRGIEIAFAGRSNVGKSSLINALTGRNALARTSHTPGRTQELIFFAAESRGALKKLKALERAMQRAGALWVVYPKGVKHITQLDVMAAAKAAGLVDVKVVSFSATHTALKLMIPLARR